MTPELQQRIEEIASRYPRRRSALLPALHLVQRESGGYVGPDQLAAVADLIGVPVSEAYGVQTYYTMFERRPLGRYHLQVDTNVPACSPAPRPSWPTSSGRSASAWARPRRTAVHAVHVECLASCGTCPVIQVGDRYYESMTPNAPTA